MAFLPPPEKKKTTEASDRLERQAPADRALKAINYKLMALAAAVIVGGFLLMLGPGSTQTQFNPDIFSWRRTVAGPTIAFLGYLFMGAAIMWPTRKTPASDK